jgi:eukaryotic-like serine/threonine-protein kinase
MGVPCTRRYAFQFARSFLTRYKRPMSPRTMISRFFQVGLFIGIFMAAAGVGTYFAVHLLIHGKNNVIVPDLQGKEVVYALEILSDLGLNTKVKGARYSPTIPKNHIIAQAPEPGAERKHGRDVRLVISRGPYAVVIPNLIGMALPIADIALEENDLHRGALSYTYHGKRPKDEILAQLPGPGTTALRESQLNLLVSLGPRPQLLRMPDLLGQGFEHAFDAVEKCHLTVGSIAQADDPDKPDNTVLEQSPSGGYPVPAGSSIALTINRHARKFKDYRRQTVTLFRHRAPQGFLRQHVRVRTICPDGAFDIFNNFIRPGEEIWLVILRDKPTALFLYLDGDLRMTKNYD